MRQTAATGTRAVEGLDKALGAARVLDQGGLTVGDPRAPAG